MSTTQTPSACGHAHYDEKNDAKAAARRYSTEKRPGRYDVERCPRDPQGRFMFRPAPRARRIQRAQRTQRLVWAA